MLDRPVQIHSPRQTVVVEAKSDKGCPTTDNLVCMGFYFEKKKDNAL